MDNVRFFYDLVLLLGYAIAAWTITRRYLQFYQQDEYDSRRFLKWWLGHLAIEKRTTLILVLLMAASAMPAAQQLESLLFAGVGAFLIAVAGLSNQGGAAKKPLVMTARARRIFLAAMVLQILAAFGLGRGLVFITPQEAFLPGMLLALLAVNVLNPLSLCAANGLLWPSEAYVQRRFRKEAEEKLATLQPFIIGITGSYGKTSTKHILNHILNAHAPTLATPGSVNTVMGNTRVIRERLTREHDYLIAEMGAYAIGSIQRLCDLTPPNAAIVTAVGMAHYERFKSVEAVAQAKSELPQNVPPDGFAVLNGDNPYCRNMANGIEAEPLFYGRDAEAGQLHCRLINEELTPEGIRFQVIYEGETYTIQTPVFGSHMAMNAAGAFLTACRLGVPPLTAVAALRTVPQVDHRLVVSQDAQGVYIIDDAYNANPTGFRSALDVLEVLPVKRRIVVTPGMVELGAREDEEYRKIAPRIAEVCDLVCLVAAHRLGAMIEGLQAQNFPPEKLKTFHRFEEANQFLRETLQEGDAVLYENDLPDLYEEKHAFRLFPTAKGGHNLT